MNHFDLSCLEIERLPFVQSDEDDVSFWHVEASGHDEIDLAAGEAFAELALETAKRFDMPVLIATILRDMIHAGNFTGLEAGFLGVIASTARAGAMH